MVSVSHERVCELPHCLWVDPARVDPLGLHAVREGVDGTAADGTALGGLVGHRWRRGNGDRGR